MGETATPPVPGDAPPDWGATEEEVLCPLCGYDLRGLVEPRCPECGYAFTWAGLLEARRTVHPYLFEHHPERNVRSFVRTLAAGVRPRRFWGTLTAGHPVRVRRLAVYWFVLVMLALLVVVVPGALRARTQYQSQTAARAYNLQVYGTAPSDVRQQVIRQYGSVQAFVDRICPPPTVAGVAAKAWGDEGRAVVLWAFYAAWPFLTAGVLMVYRRSTRRAAIRVVQVWRCTVYSSGVGAWAGVVAVLLAGYFMLRPMIGKTPVDTVAYAVTYWANRVLDKRQVWLWLVVAGVMTYQLTVAYGRYLKMRRAWVAVPLAQVVVLLIYLQLYVWWIGVEAR